MQTYGTPGGSLGGQQRQYGKARSEIGAKGEQATARMLEKMFAKHDDVACFHDVNIPGAQANADHVIVRGHNVVIIDSKMWAPGFYWTVGGKTRRGWQLFKPADNRTVPMAVRRISEALQGTGARVSGVVAVHPSRPGFFSLLLAKCPSKTMRASRALRYTKSRLGVTAQQQPEILRRINQLTRY